MPGVPRLRTRFNDPILARRGNTYELTPFAVHLAEHTTAALEAARRVFESQATWSPEESTREFSMYGSDYGFVTVGSVVSRLGVKHTPGVRFRFMLHNPAIVDDAAGRLRSVDRIISPHGPLSDPPYAGLSYDDWAAIVADSHEAVGDVLTGKRLGRRQPWVRRQSLWSRRRGVRHQPRAAASLRPARTTPSTPIPAATTMAAAETAVVTVGDASPPATPPSHGPEDATGRRRRDARREGEGVRGGEGRHDGRQREHAERDADDQAPVDPRERLRERDARDDHGQRPDRDEQADLHRRDAEIRRHLGHEPGRQRLGGDGDEHAEAQDEPGAQAKL
ncbi:hypothetical protein [Microbacterium sp. LWS13-1.2]|uniref:Uncharacterized protein n=1 Tax=Microbacterium sp. LWS13-1.2 TaxID=3135264 RepID=A0AAU6SCA9_9MICO